jgi:hypothetical protein
MSIYEELNKLINCTTIYLINSDHNDIVIGEEKLTRFQTDEGEPQTIESLEKTWQTIFDQFGNQWNSERQLYRLLYDQVRLFITSFTFLRVHKINLIESRMRDENSFRQFSNCLASMYIFGKKATDLVLEIDKSESKQDFSKRFSNTRNLIFEHNYSSYLLKNCIVEPSFFNSSGTSSELKVIIHTQHNEAAYNAYADYYEDYYMLENELIKWLKSKLVM